MPSGGGENVYGVQKKKKQLWKVNKGADLKCVSSLCKQTDKLTSPNNMADFLESVVSALSSFMVILIDSLMIFLCSYLLTLCQYYCASLLSAGGSVW